jgi:excisionase family DNA binding protein
MTNTTDQETLNFLQFANRLGIHRQTVGAMVARGEVRVVRVGQRDRIPASELSRLLATASARPVTAPWSRDISRRLEQLDAERAELVERLAAGGVA